MKLEVNKKCAGDGLAKYFAGWTRQEFKGLLHQIQNGHIKKDGSFYKHDYESYKVWINAMYNALTSRFEVNLMKTIDERDTVLRMLETLSAEQFKSFAELAFEPYANLEDNVEIVFEG